MLVQQIADRVAQNLEIISTNLHFSTKRTGILMGFIISTKLSRGTHRKSHGQNSGSLKRCRNNLKMLCHPIGNQL